MESISINKRRHIFYETLYRERIIPLFSTSDKNQALNTVKALIDGGLSIIEFTFREKNSIEIFSEILREFGKKCFIGVGSIMNSIDASVFVNIGADFIVSPVFDRDTAFYCNSKKIPYIPACLTPTEISNAMKYGAEFIKLFPAGANSPNYIKGIKAPLKNISIIATGGIDSDEKSLRNWLKTCEAVGLGSSLINKTLIENSEYDTIKKRAYKLTEIVKSI